MGWAGMRRDCNYEGVGTPSWECACGAAVQEPSCMADSQSEQCSSAWDSGGNEMQMPHSEVWERCRNMDCAGCERGFIATSRSNLQEVKGREA